MYMYTLVVAFMYMYTLVVALSSPGFFGDVALAGFFPYFLSALLVYPYFSDASRTAFFPYVSSTAIWYLFRLLEDVS